MGKLYMVATPIGNLEDITLRAIRILKEVDIVFAEDTRVTKRLFEAHGITSPLKSLNARTESAKSSQVVELLRDGKNVAYVSDAGTPGISDPGSILVSRVREDVPEADIVAIPGSSALAASLSVAGVDVSSFVFLGFLPHKKGRETLFAEIRDSKRAVVFYESPHRIEKTLDSLCLYLDDRREVVVCRELTKIYEETVAGNAEEIRSFFKDNPEHLRGEFVVIISYKK